VCESALARRRTPISFRIPDIFSAPPRKILIVKPSALGDIVHTLPILALLRKRFPKSHIAWLVAQPFAGLIDGHPMLNQLIRFQRGGESPAMAFMSLLRELGELNFDLVVDLQGLARSAMLTFATGARLRVGFRSAREFAPLAYTHKIDSRGDERHAVERYLDVAEALDCGRGPIEFPFVIDRSRVESQISSSQRTAVLLPGTNWETKKWPVSHYARLSELLVADGYRVIVAGAKDAVPLAKQIPTAIDLTNQTTLPQLVALLERADIVIANDSGPMHIAAALGRPLVTIFGPTTPVRTGPFDRMDTVIRLNIACSPCYSRRCSHTSCMNWLTPEMVMRQVRATVQA
jgi:heptosyltransferase I